MSDINYLVLEQLQRLKQLTKVKKEEERKLIPDVAVYPIEDYILNKYLSTRDYGYKDDNTLLKKIKSAKYKTPRK